jgi:beta-glucosidase-like glycosyl hydrolase
MCRSWAHQVPRWQHLNAHIQAAQLALNRPVYVLIEQETGLHSWASDVE